MSEIFRWRRRVVVTEESVENGCPLVPGTYEKLAPFDASEHAGSTENQEKVLDYVRRMGYVEALPDEAPGDAEPPVTPSEEQARMDDDGAPAVAPLPDD